MNKNSTLEWEQHYVEEVQLCHLYTSYLSAMTPAGAFLAGVMILFMVEFFLETPHLWIVCPVIYGLSWVNAFRLIRGLPPISVLIGCS